MNQQGWIKVWRKMEDWEWYKVSNMTHLFQHLILKANHQDNRWQGISIKRGQLVTSLESLKSQTGISIKSIRTCLQKLKETGEITQKTTNRYRLITINNYNTYQIEGQAEGKLTANKGQAKGKQGATNKNVKNKENDNKDMSIFDESRKLFKGTKRGNQTEYDNFIKKYTDWKNILPLLKPAILWQIEQRAVDGRYWKNFSTWINNRCWEETSGRTVTPEQKQASEQQALEKKRQKMRTEYGQYYREQTIEKLQELRKVQITYRWLIDEILKEK